MDNGAITPSVWVQCLIPAELNACLLTSCLVVPIVVATQEIYHGTNIVSHAVDQNTP